MFLYPTLRKYYIYLPNNTSMKKVLGVSLVLILSLTGYYFEDFDVFTNLTGNVITESYISDTGEIELYFCPHQDCETPLINLINEAQTSVHCAFFELDLENLQNKILEKKVAGLDVKIVTDEQYLYEFNHSFVKTDKSGLMHNKFCIIDDKKISSGSMNPTNNGAFKNNNNLLIIESKTLATNYEAEFQEMWNGMFKKGDVVLNPNVKINNIEIQNYFCPDDNCADRIKEELKKATKSIHFMTFSFTHEGIANILLLKYAEGLNVQGIFEARQVSKYSQYENLLAKGLDVQKDSNKANMHHKTFIIDEEIVITGSMNPSNGGDKRNDENVLIIKDKQIAKRYLEEFNKLKIIN